MTRLNTLQTINQAVAPLSGGPHLLSIPVTLSDNAIATVHLTVFSRQSVRLRVAVMNPAERLLPWCQQHNVDYAMSGGFFSRQHKRPLGEVWMNGLRVETSPFGKHWAARRGTLFADDTDIRIAPLGEMPHRPRGDLMTAGPTLVRDGQSLITPGADLEGIPETWQNELDDDWTQVRAQRTAIGYDDQNLWLIAADGQSSHVWKGFSDSANTDAGLSLAELAKIMVTLGASDALNMEGGGGSTLIYDQKLVNRPRAGKFDPEPIGALMPEGRPIHSALTVLPR